MALKVSIDLDERAVERHQPPPVAGKTETDADIAALAAAVASARSEALAIVNLETAAERDGSLTPEGRALSVADAAAKSAARVAPRLDAARSRVLASVAAIQKTISAPPAPRTQSASFLEAEIRTRLSNMADKQRSAVLESALKSGDVSVLGAVLRGPAFLAGMGDAAQGLLRHRYQQTFHPTETARIERLTKALEATERAGNSFVALVRAASDSPTARLATSNAQRRAEAQAAHAAMAAGGE
jgi:hypothetical protein